MWSSEAGLAEIQAMKWSRRAGEMSLVKINALRVVGETEQLPFAISILRGRKYRIIAIIHTQ